MTKFVCANCVGDEAVKAFVELNATEPVCSYCGNRVEADDEPIGASFDVVAEFIRAAIECEYEDPANSVGYCTGEGGYLLPLLEVDDLISEVGLECSNELFLEDLSSELSDQPWIQKDPYGLSREEELRYSWEDFSRQVMHETRFVFFKITTASNQLHEPEPYKILEAIGEIVADAELDLIKTIPLNTVIVRARQHDSALTPCNSIDLGPPSDEFATQNRMSPAGISMFHGAIAELTAFKETYRLDTEMAKMTFAKFKTLRPLRLLDLTAIPPIPSFFDETHAYMRPALIFMRHFERNVSQPIDRDDAVHYRYVPTQVIAEYFWHVFKLPNGEKLDGILFNSSKDSGGKCYSLFIKNSDCVDLGSDRVKALVLSDYRKVNIDFTNAIYV